MALYSSTGSFLEAANDASRSGFAIIDTSSAPLAPGTYYVLVTSWNSGPYAMAVQTAGIAHNVFTDLSSNAQDTYEPDNLPNPFPSSPNHWPNLAVLPQAFVAMPIGSVVNRYALNGDYD